jgi:uncharacterized protein (DUF58 family)
MFHFSNIWWMKFIQVQVLIFFLGVFLLLLYRQESNPNARLKREPPFNRVIFSIMGPHRLVNSRYTLSIIAPTVDIKRTRFRQSPSTICELNVYFK